MPVWNQRLSPFGSADRESTPRRVKEKRNYDGAFFLYFSPRSLFCCYYYSGFVLCFVCGVLGLLFCSASRRPCDYSSELIILPPVVVLLRYTVRYHTGYRLSYWVVCKCSTLRSRVSCENSTNRIHFLNFENLTPTPNTSSMKAHESRVVSHFFHSDSITALPVVTALFENLDRANVLLKEI